MPEPKSDDAQGAASTETNPRRAKYSESYRQLYGLRQDVLDKTRQLEWSLDRIVMYVRDLLR